MTAIPVETDMDVQVGLMKGTIKDKFISSALMKWSKSAWAMFEHSIITNIIFHMKNCSTYNSKKVILEIVVVILFLKHQG